MPDEKTYAETFEALWPTLQLDPSTDAPSATIRPSLSESEGSQQRAIQALLPTPSSSGAVRNFGTTLGEGGMGVVRLAEQSSMQREVAVKSLRSKEVRPQVARRLIQEAWITGYLEHPNIVPVYDIAQDEDGNPVILMKRIEGRTWEALAGDPEAVLQSFGAADLQEWNLRIFLTVCNAVHFAHEHGVLHRDIKPENIMIGQFGEVYLLDWGIAVSLDTRHEGRLPLASREKRIAGTPRFMAPEMAIGGTLSVHTDVYLLGASLFAVLTGHPPHRGRDLEKLLKSIGDFAPSFDADVPEALARIVRRATAPIPNNRYASVDALSKAVVRYLERRGSVALTAEAASYLTQMQAGPEHMQGLYSRATFGFQQALRGWSDNNEAAEGLRRSHEVRFDDAVQKRMIDVARAALTELEDPARATQIDTLAAELAIEAAEVDALRLAADPLAGIRTRLFVLAIVAVLWVLMPIRGMYSGLPTWTDQFASSATLLVFFLALGFWARESLFKTDLNRSVTLILLSIPLGQLVLDTVAWRLDLGSVQAFALRQGLWFSFALVFALVVVPRLLPAAIIVGAMAVLSAVDPLNSYGYALVSNVSLAANAALVWGPAFLEQRRNA